MRRILIALLCFLVLITLVSCVNIQGAYTQPKPSKTEFMPSETITMPSKTLPPQTDTLPSKTDTISPEVKTETPKVETTPPITVVPPYKYQTNTSVNVAWGGEMCEANGFVYYVTCDGSNEKIIRMELDGSNPKPITTGKYSYLYQLTSDGCFLYFVSYDEIDTIYRIPLSGGKEQKVTQGSVYELQSANGRLYWVENTPDGNGYYASNSIKCMNSDGSDIRSLYTFQSSADIVGFELLVSEANIYYAAETLNSDLLVESDVFRMDLDGQNTVKLNAEKVSEVDKLFYDQGRLYLLTEEDDDTNDSLQIIDSNGKVTTLLKDVGYFPQDEGELEYCGISNHKFYHFCYSTNSFDLRQFDLISRKDTIKIKNVKMKFGTLYSVRGKAIKNSGGVTGLYIVGNDIYFSRYEPYY